MSNLTLWQERLVKGWTQNTSPQINAIYVLAGIVNEVGTKIARELDTLSDQVSRLADAVEELEK